MDEEDVSSLDNMSYVTYAKKTFKLGRQKIKLEWKGLSGYEKGAEPGAKFRATIQYDADMTIYLLNYADFWPYLSGEPLTEEALKNLDREIFALRGRNENSYEWQAVG
ncbi:hypothetical protein ACHAPJ_008415 [Fusarium lateritium]